MITGANVGIGKSVAVDLARRGARVILGCRDQKRAEVARDDIIRETGVSQDMVKFIKIDLSSFKSVR